MPGWEYDPPQTVSADAARSTRLRLDEGHAIILTRDPSGRPAECILNGETWYYNGNLHYVIPYDDLVARGRSSPRLLIRRSLLSPQSRKACRRVWAVAGLLDKLDQSRGSSDAGIAVSELLKSVKDIAPKGSRCPRQRCAKPGAFEKIVRLIAGNVQPENVRQGAVVRKLKSTLIRVDAR
jgi:hypothetical protein